MIATNRGAEEIEHDANRILGSFRRKGEWFAVHPNLAIQAVLAAARNLGIEVLRCGPTEFEDVRIHGFAKNIVIRLQGFWLDAKTHQSVLQIMIVLLATLVYAKWETLVTTMRNIFQ